MKTQNLLQFSEHSPDSKPTRKKVLDVGDRSEPTKSTVLPYYVLWTDTTTTMNMCKCIVVKIASLAKNVLQTLYSCNQECLSSG